MILPTIDWIFYDLDKGIYILNDPSSYLTANSGNRIVEILVGLNSPLSSGIGLDLINAPVKIKSNSLIYDLKVNNSNQAELYLSGTLLPLAFGSVSGSFLATSGGTLSGFLTLHSDPTNSGHASTKQYVDNRVAAVSGAYVAADTVLSGALNTLINNKVSKSGDTMSGFLTLHADPTNSGHASTKQYVDTRITAVSGAYVTADSTLSGVLTSAINLKANLTYVDSQDTVLSGLINNKVAKAGDTMIGFLTLHADPTNSGHAVPKQYVDARDFIISGNLNTLSGNVVFTSGNQTVSGEKSFVNLKANSITNIDSNFEVTVTGNNSLIVSVSGNQLVKVSPDGSFNIASQGNFTNGCVFLTNKHSTTTSTTVTIWNFPLENNSLYRFKLSTDSITTSGTHRARSKGMIVSYYRKNNAAPVRVSTQTTFRNVADLGTNMDSFFTISGNNILIQNQSTAVQNVSWISVLEYQKVTW